jgi:ectoine hydroxylase-related dioxygenase (phytanoyl-CoA dioxygenase family)
MGFWFNAMQPGDKTARHNHDEEDELLSCVYYITAPQQSGDLLLFDREETLRVTPEAGKLVLFSPKLAHAVDENRSDQQRLSVAFNFGLGAS